MQTQDLYNQQKVNSLLKSDFITDATRNALKTRITLAKEKNHFFSDYSFSLLSIVCDRLVDQDSENRIVNIAVFIDKRLFENTCDGWRYNLMPPDKEMIVKGLEGIDESSGLIFGNTFINLKYQEQLQILNRTQQGNAPGKVWEKLSSNKFFEELLTESAEIFFSYPAVQAEIGYVGMADAKGWAKVGLNESEKIEKEWDER